MWERKKCWMLSCAMGERKREKMWKKNIGITEKTKKTLKNWRKKHQKNHKTLKEIKMSKKHQNFKIKHEKILKPPKHPQNLSIPSTSTCWFKLSTIFILFWLFLTFSLHLNFPPLEKLRKFTWKAKNQKSPHGETTKS